MKRVCMLVAAFLLAASSATAQITVSPDSVNRIIAGGFADNHFSSNFSTHGSNSQKTLLELSTATLQSELATTLGPLGTGESYQINSATLTVGSASDDYATTGGADVYTVFVPWDSSDVTWNEADADANIAWSMPGLAAGVDYAALAADTGSVGTNTTTWSNLG